MDTENYLKRAASLRHKSEEMRERASATTGTPRDYWLALARVYAGLADDAEYIAWFQFVL